MGAGLNTRILHRPTAQKWRPGPLRDQAFPVEIERPTGEPVREILQLEKYADLVVCGSRGLGGASRFLLDSVSDQRHGWLLQPSSAGGRSENPNRADL